MAHLNDRSTYEILRKDPTKSTEKAVNSLFTEWEEKSFIIPNQGEFLRSYTSVCPKSYLTIKIIKDDNPGRPVVSFINAPTYKISKNVQQDPEICCWKNQQNNQEFETTKRKIVTSSSP